MYKIEVDSTKKLVKVTVSGFIKIEEINAMYAEFQNTLKNIKPQEAVFMADLLDFKPASRDVIPIIQKMQVECIDYFKKTASVTQNVVSEMQLKRIEGELEVKPSFERFKSEEEALKYLLG